MSATVIKSIRDPRVAAYRRLIDRKSQPHAGRFIVEGKWLTQRLLASDYEVESILTVEGHPLGVPPPDDIPVFVMPRGQLDDMVGFRFHRGVLACGLRRPSRPLNECLPDAPAAALVVICSAVSDPQNLGGILRNCAAFGVDAVLLDRRCADPLARRVVRVSMGAALQTNVCHSQSLDQDLRTLRERHHIHLVAAVADPAAPTLAEGVPARRRTLLFGNEGHGLDVALVKYCHETRTIPMRPGTDSLNVAVSCGIFLYHYGNKKKGNILEDCSD